MLKPLKSRSPWNGAKPIEVPLGGFAPRAAYTTTIRVRASDDPILTPRGRAPVVVA